MASLLVRAYKGVWGRAPGQGSEEQSPPEAEALLVFGHSMEATDLPTFLQFGNANKSDIYVIFAKKYGWPRNWGGAWSKTEGLCPLFPSAPA